MYYRPALPDGRPVKLPWQIQTLYLNITWPLKDNPALWMEILNYVMVSTGFIIFAYVDEGELYFILKNFNDINLSVEALVTCIVLNESFLRIFGAAFTKNSFKMFLKDFFRNVYIDEEENAETGKQIRQELIPTTVFTYGYILTLISFLMGPFLKLRRNEKSLPYKMILHYGYDESLVYGFTQLYLCWVGAAIIFFFIGDGFMLASCVLHLNARYQILQNEVKQCGSKLLSKVSRARLAPEFHRSMVRAYVRTCNLNSFAEFLSETYNFRIFVMIAFSAGLLCVLCFQVASLGVTSENIAYASWTIAKIAELLIFGSLGTTLIQTTDKMSLTYYLTNWEEIIYLSTDRKANILLMKDLQMIMSLHRKPMRLSGFQFFDISLDTSIKVLRLAFSYFTCLYTIKQTAEI